MSLTEFQSIRDYFSKQTIQRPDVLLGIGDDCALLSVPQDKQLAMSVDTLVSGVHFPEHTSAEDIGYKSLAVSLSDLAAMGAEPAWVSLALTMPRLEETWLTDFCRGFFTLAQRYNVQLVGGDTTTGPLVVTTQIHGYVAQQQALRRSGAKPGDLIYVTGNIGEAGLGLLLVQQKLELPPQFAELKNHLIARLNRPTARVEVGLALRGVASAAIDISDGVAADLNHILTMSEVGASINATALPVSECFPAVSHRVGGVKQPLTAGDDYELLFTAAPQMQDRVQRIAEHLQCKITCVGEIQAAPGLRCYLNGELLQLNVLGYEHFKS